MMLTLATLVLLVALAATAVAVVLSTPYLRAVRESQRIDQEARFAQWRLQQVADEAMQRLLEEARRPR